MDRVRTDPYWRLREVGGWRRAGIWVASMLLGRREAWAWAVEGSELKDWLESARPALGARHCGEDESRSKRDR